MRIQVISDLHIEATRDFSFAGRLWGDVVVLPGDLGNEPELYEAVLMAIPQPKIVVLGNNEHYHRDLDEAEAVFSEIAHRVPETHLLIRDSVVLNRVRFLGCTLWSDFGGAVNFDAARTELFPFKKNWLYQHGFPATPELIAARHAQEAHWLEQMLRCPHEGPTVVVTHFAPTATRCGPAYSEIQQRWMGVDLEHLIQAHAPALWIHGHRHEHYDACIGSTRLYCNAVGPDFPDIEEIEWQKRLKALSPHRLTLAN